MIHDHELSPEGLIPLYQNILICPPPPNKMICYYSPVDPPAIAPARHVYALCTVHKAQLRSATAADDR